MRRNGPQPSLLQFQAEMAKIHHQNNMQTLFDVKTIPSSNTIKDILDNQDGQQFQPIHKNITQRLQRSKPLEKFDLLPGYKICSMDATHYHQPTTKAACVAPLLFNRNKLTIMESSCHSLPIRMYLIE